MVMKEALAVLSTVYVFWLTGVHWVCRGFSNQALLSGQLWKATEVIESALVVELKLLWNVLEFKLCWLFHCVTSAREWHVFLGHAIVNTLEVAIWVTLILEAFILKKQVINVQDLVNWIARLGVLAWSALVLSCQWIYHRIGVRWSARALLAEVERVDAVVRLAYESQWVT